MEEKDKKAEDNSFGNRCPECGSWYEDGVCDNHHEQEEQKN